MQRVFVVDANRTPLMPCHPARAKELLDKGKAAILRRFPFTIILNHVVENLGVQPTHLKIDPGSRVTGLALVASFKRGRVIIWAAEIGHRGLTIRDGLMTRRAIRRSRRSRKTRYRAARYHNRIRKAGWVAPSLRSRVQNVRTWVDRLARFVAVSMLSLESARFDTQLMQDAEISGVEYQQGELQGYEVREYLLEKWGRRCVYCGKIGVPLQIEHLTPPKRHGGSNRVSNLALACEQCNQTKGNRTAAEFGFPHLHDRAKQPLKDAAALNATRQVLWCKLRATELPLEVGNGGRTKFNRIQQNYPKAHWIDAACVGESGEHVCLYPTHVPLSIRAVGRQSRQMCLMDKFGFPRTRPKQKRIQHGFQTGDVVKATVTKGKHAGIHLGRIAVRAKGTFRVGNIEGISFRHLSAAARCRWLRLFICEERCSAFRPPQKQWVSYAKFYEKQRRAVS